MTGIDSFSGRNSALDCKYVGLEFERVRGGIFSPLPLPLSCGYYMASCTLQDCCDSLLCKGWPSGCF